MPTLVDNLRAEFDEHEGSFMLKLRCDLTWDKALFGKLLTCMYQIADSKRADENLDRWTAEGFWYLDSFVEQWATHPNFPREHDESYYSHSFLLLHDVAYLFFRGQSPYNNPSTLADKIKAHPTE